MQDLSRLLERIARLAGVAPLDHHADFHAIDGLLHPLIIADAQKQQIGGHLGRLFEPHALKRAGQRRHLIDRHVGNRHLVFRRIDADGECGLACGFIPTGQKLARAGRLEIGRQGAARSACALIIHGEKAQGIACDRAAIIDGENMLARRYRPRRMQSFAPQLGVGRR